MFTSRSASQGNASAPPPQSIEEVRRRARHRLIGAAVLVLLAVVGFSLLFDTQPRPLPVDIPIVIPAKNAHPPLALPKPSAPASEPAQATPRQDTTTASVKAQDSLGPREEVVAPSSPSAAASTADTPAKPRAEAQPVSPPKVEATAKPLPPKPAAPTESESERARALLDGQAADKIGDKTGDKPGDTAAAGPLRIVVQVGAFADVTRAREARLKLERAGLKTYTHVAETAEGKRIRVRVGPFASKAEADKAAARVKALGLPAAILTL